MKKIKLEDGREFVENERGGFDPVTADASGDCGCEKPKVEANADADNVGGGGGGEMAVMEAMAEQITTQQAEIATLTTRLDDIEQVLADLAMTSS